MLSYCGCFQGFPGFRGKPGIAGVIGKTVSLALFVLKKRFYRSSLQAERTTGPISE